MDTVKESVIVLVADMIYVYTFSICKSKPFENKSYKNVEYMFWYYSKVTKCVVSK